MRTRGDRSSRGLGSASEEVQGSPGRSSRYAGTSLRAHLLSGDVGFASLIAPYSYIIEPTGDSAAKARGIYFRFAIRAIEMFTFYYVGTALRVCACGPLPECSASTKGNLNARRVRKGVILLRNLN